jgi:hypothetical protein
MFAGCWRRSLATDISSGTRVAIIDQVLGGTALSDNLPLFIKLSRHCCDARRLNEISARILTSPHDRQRQRGVARIGPN